MMMIMINDDDDDGDNNDDDDHHRRAFNSFTKKDVGLPPYAVAETNASF